MVTFFQRGLDKFRPLLGHESPLKALDHPDYRRALETHSACWLLQTYLHLRSRGIQCAISDRISTDENIVIMHYDDYMSVSVPSNCFAIVIRGDRAPVYADLVIDQNKYIAQVDGSNFMPHWTEPCLVPRDVRRENRISRLAFYGALPNLAPDFRTDSFRSQLSDLGVELTISLDPSQWSDFSNVDAMIAVRNYPRSWIATKPATKLVNAGRAGVVPFLGKEPGYRAIAEAGLDFIEVSKPVQVIDQIKRINANPEVYSDLVTRARLVAKANDTESTISHWRAFIEQVAIPQHEEWLIRFGDRRSVLDKRRSDQKRKSRTAHKLFWLKFHAEDIVRNRRYMGHNKTLAAALGRLGFSRA